MTRKRLFQLFKIFIQFWVINKRRQLQKGVNINPPWEYQMMVLRRGLRGGMMVMTVWPSTVMVIHHLSTSPTSQQLLALFWSGAKLIFNEPSLHTLILQVCQMTMTFWKSHKRRNKTWYFSDLALAGNITIWNGNYPSDWDIYYHHTHLELYGIFRGGRHKVKYLSKGSFITFEKKIIIHPFRYTYLWKSMQCVRYPNVYPGINLK